MAPILLPEFSNVHLGVDDLIMSGGWWQYFGTVVVFFSLPTSRSLLEPRLSKTCTLGPQQQPLLFNSRRVKIDSGFAVSCLHFPFKGPVCKV